MDRIVYRGGEAFHVRNRAFHRINAGRGPAFAGDRTVGGGRRSIAPIPEVGQRVAIRIAGGAGEIDADIDRRVRIRSADVRRWRKVARNSATVHGHIDPVDTVRIRAAGDRRDVDACRGVGESLADRQNRVGLFKGIRSHIEQQRLLVAAVDAGPVHQHAILHAIARAIELTMFDPVIIRAVGTIHHERPLISIRLILVHGAEACGGGAIGRDFHQVRVRHPIEIIFQTRTKMPGGMRRRTHAHRVEDVAVILHLACADDAAIIRVPSARMRRAEIMP